MYRYQSYSRYHWTHHFNKFSSICVLQGNHFLQKSNHEQDRCKSNKFYKPNHLKNANCYFNLKVEKTLRFYSKLILHLHFYIFLKSRKIPYTHTFQRVYLWVFQAAVYYTTSFKQVSLLMKHIVAHERLSITFHHLSCKNF